MTDYDIVSGGHQLLISTNIRVLHSLFLQAYILILRIWAFSAYSRENPIEWRPLTSL